MVEHDLAKVGVASSSLVSRSRFNSETSGNRGFVFLRMRLRQDGARPRHQEGSRESAIRMARWQSGHAAACKAVYAGSIPTLASIRHPRAPRALESPRIDRTLPARPGGEIGRRKGLKIPRRESVMPVRVRLRAPRRHPPPSISGCKTAELPGFRDCSRIAGGSRSRHGNPHLARSETLADSCGQGRLARPVSIARPLRALVRPSRVPPATNARDLTIVKVRIVAAQIMTATSVIPLG